MTNKNEYTCEECHQTFEKGWSDEEALKEFQTEYTVSPDEVPGGAATVCEDCYQRIMEKVHAYRTHR